MECQLENININYETFGEGRPVVLLHGFWIDHRQIAGCMEPVFEKRDGWKRIYPDLPGMGKTPGMEWITNADQMLDIVCQFIDAIIPDEDFVLGGYSYGSYLARGVLHRKFTQVDGLFISCPVIDANFAERTRPPQEILIKDPDLVAKLTPEDREDFESWVAVQSQKIFDRTQAEVVAGSRLANEPFLSRLQAEGYILSFDVNNLARPFEKPTLIIAGRQDWVVGYRDAWKIIEQYPRATFGVLDRAGHNLPIVQEELFNALVSEWLYRVEENFTQQRRGA